MKNPTIHYIRATVAAGSLTAVLLVGLPLADEYFEHRSAEIAVRQMQSELADLRRANTAASRERALGAEQFAELNRRATTIETVSQAREAFVEMARDSGCHVRLINASEPERRPWAGDGDDPLAGAISRGASGGAFELHTTRINLTVVGRLESIQELTRQISGRRFLSVTDYVAIQPTEATGDSVQMELRIRLFGLVERSGETETDASVREVSRHVGKSD